MPKVMKEYGKIDLNGLANNLRLRRQWFCDRIAAKTEGGYCIDIGLQTIFLSNMMLPQAFSLFSAHT